MHKPGVGNRVPDALSYNHLHDSSGPLDVFSGYSNIAALNLCIQPLIELGDRQKICQIQLANCFAI